MGLGYGMSEKHLRFCLSHDWGREAKLIGGKIVDIIDFQTWGRISFSSFKELLGWAGY